jgi:5-methylcytosine-specific restriction endonuclease McrA
VEEFSIASWPAHARMRVEQRDHGVCAKCGRDCAALWTKLDALIHLVYSSEPATKRRGYRWWKLALRLGLSGGYSYCLRSLWDADHIVPVVEGGGGCGLDNLRTLCRPCHKEETRALARRRAEARRTAKEFA